VFTRDDVTVTLIVAVSLIGAAAGTAVAYGVLTSGGSDSAAAIFGTLAGLAAGIAAALVIARVFWREDVHGLERMELGEGIVLWVRVRSLEQEEKAQEILLRNGGRAVRVHEIEIEKRSDDLPLSGLRPDPWLGSEPLGRL
jgi:hypothetical protein